MPFLFRFLSRLPLPLLHVLGCLLGWLTYALSPTYRRHLRANLAQALGDRAGFFLAWRVAAEAGKGVLELPAIWLRSLEQATALVRDVRGWDEVAAAQDSGRGVIFLTPHLGCFEITAQWLSTRLPLTVLYRAPKQPWLEAMMRAGRTRPGMTSVPADLSGVRALLKVLRQRGNIGILPDQAPGAGEGAWLPFFGRPAYTMTLAARLSETGAAVVFLWGERLPGGGGFRLHFQRPQVPLDGDTLTRAAAINREVEALIRQCPVQYLWGYNRYKQPGGAEPPPAWDRAA